MNINTNISNNVTVSNQNKMGFAEIQKKEAKLTEKFNRLNELIVKPEAMNTEPLCTKKAAIDNEIKDDYKKSIVEKYRDKYNVMYEKASIQAEIDKLNKEKEKLNKLNEEYEKRGREINYA